jgi:hypothetical protein
MFEPYAQKKHPEKISGCMRDCPSIPENDFLLRLFLLFLLLPLFVFGS